MATPGRRRGTLPMRVGEVTDATGARASATNVVATRARRPGHGAHTDHDGLDEPGRPASSRIAAWAAVLGLSAVIIVAVMAQDRSPRQVVVAPPIGEAWTAPDAPAHQVIRRWEWVAPERTRLSGLAVHGDEVVVQTTPLDRGVDPVVSTVVAVDMLTGATRWTVDIPMSRPYGPRGLELTPTVHVVEASGASLLTPTDPVWPQGTSVGLDAGSGRVLWERDDVLGAARLLGGAVLAVSDPVTEPLRRVVGGGSDDLATPGDPDVPPPVSREVVDMRTGETVFSTTGILAATPDGWVTWQWQDGDRWSARILDATGAEVANVPSSAQPAVLGDLVVTLEGDEVVVRDLRGRQVWATTDPELARGADRPRVVGLQPLGPDVVLVAGHHLAAAPDEDGNRTDTSLSLVHEDGTATPVVDPTLVDIAANASFAGVRLGNRSQVVCTADPSSGGTATDIVTPPDATSTSPAAGCPAAVAVMAHDHEADTLTTTARAGDPAILGDHLDTPRTLAAVPTNPGVVVAEPGAVVLRAWEDLTTLWRIEVDDRRAGSITVATSRRGVAVGIETPHPSTVTWLS